MVQQRWRISKRQSIKVSVAMWTKCSTGVTPKTYIWGSA